MGEKFEDSSWNIFPGVKTKKYSKQEILDFVRKAKKGDEAAYHEILCQMHSYLCHLTKEFFIQGAESKDLYQEGAIKLINVIQKYDEEKGSFVYFAQSSIRKHIITSINKEQAKKRMVLNSSYSLSDETKNKDGETVSFIDTLSDQNNIMNPMTENAVFPIDVIEKDYEDFLIEKISAVLSPMEKKIFVLRFIEGHSYKEVADILNLKKIDAESGEVRLDQKSVDNAIWRSRPKIKKVLETLKINPDFIDEQERQMEEMEKQTEDKNKNDKDKTRINNKKSEKKIGDRNAKNKKI